MVQIIHYMFVTMNLIGCQAFLIHPFLESEPLTVGRAMSTLSLFQVLQFPCIQITHFITTFVNANVSVKRLLPFFLAEEVEGPGGRGAKTHTHSIGVEMAEMEVRGVVSREP